MLAATARCCHRFVAYVYIWRSHIGAYVYIDYHTTAVVSHILLSYIGGYCESELSLSVGVIAVSDGKTICVDVEPAPPWVCQFAARASEEPQETTVFRQIPPGEPVAGCLFVIISMPG